ncbi:Map1-related protein [Ehrlichia ruminantium str. Gardel]|uniref:Map1-6 n=1 Tax=Ehrlichia ruminantium TaxID=779 RepID=Q4L0C5_EHRRU|nr:P44/Msp2 family outer membrane protein [Ehrlichia ruminantium]AAV73819.1 Map1-6 [Ehrlichia ruminantium]CAI28361.1 Map1-related protein [Ehrlichia ruminantium str. Gardel]
MNKNRKLILNTALVFSLLSFLPHQVLSIPINNSISKYSGIYFSGSYKLEFPLLDNFSIKETTSNTKQVIGLSKKKEAENVKDILGYHAAFNEPYTPTFQNTASGFSGTAGYSYTNKLRFEIEVSYEKFDAEIPEGSIYDDYIEDTYRYFALARETSHSLGASSRITPKYNHYIVMKNNGVSITSFMVNNCYQFSTSQSNKILPYICGGVGTDLVQFFNKLHIKLACQVKLGTSYSLSPHYQLFANVYYHEVIGNYFNKLKPIRTVLPTNTTSTELSNVSATSTLNISYFGSEIGLRFIL